MIKKILIILFIHLMIYSLNSAEHRLGVSLQGDYTGLIYGLNNLNGQFGFSHSVEINKNFLIENDFLCGMNYIGFVSGTYYGGGASFMGFTMTFTFYPIFRFGNKRIKFFFSTLDPALFIALGVYSWYYDYAYAYDEETDRFYTESGNAFMWYLGVNFIQKIGFYVYAGKENKIAVAPLYIYTGFSLLFNRGGFAGHYPLPVIGVGTAINIKLGKKNIEL